MNNKNTKILIGTARNTHWVTKYIQSFGHNIWRASTTCQMKWHNDIKVEVEGIYIYIYIWMWNWVVHLIIGTGGLICGLSSVILNQINGRIESWQPGDSKVIKIDSAARSDAFKCLDLGQAEMKNIQNCLVCCSHCI